MTEKKEQKYCKWLDRDTVRDFLRRVGKMQNGKRGEIHENRGVCRNVDSANNRLVDITRCPGKKCFVEGLYQKQVVEKPKVEEKKPKKEKKVKKTEKDVVILEGARRTKKLITATKPITSPAPSEEELLRKKTIILGEKEEELSRLKRLKNGVTIVKKVAE